MSERTNNELFDEVAAATSVSNAVSDIQHVLREQRLDRSRQSRTAGWRTIGAIATLRLTSLEGGADPEKARRRRKALEVKTSATAENVAAKDAA